MLPIIGRTWDKLILNICFHLLGTMGYDENVQLLEYHGHFGHFSLQGKTIEMQPETNKNAKMTQCFLV